MAENKLVDDNYLPCNAYKGHSKDDNMVARFEQGGEFYFAILDDSDDVILRSEGYKAEKGRDNGVESVLKNMVNEERYNSWQLPDGLWVLSLKAANHQEIARSCSQTSEAEARAFLPSERVKVKSTTMNIMAGDTDRAKTGTNEDNYLGCNIYESNISSKSKYPDFSSFKHANGQFYFSWISGSILVMRSEGYKTEAARDNGIESVIKNRSDKTRYSTEQAHGAHFLVLKAGNHQEIARSCPKKSSDDAWGALSTTAVAASILTATTKSNTSNTTKSAIAKSADAKVSSVADPVITNEIKENSGCMKWLWPLLALLLLGALLWWFWGKNYFAGNCEKPAVAATTMPAASDTIQLDSLALATKALWDSTLGKMVEIKLVDGTAISVPENGSEKRLVEYLNGGCSTDINKTWFNMDRVLFKTGSAELNSVSMDQLGVLAKIFKAYSTSKFKIGGYTDNVGSVDINKKLSADRAASVMNAINSLGMDSTRLRSKGFGPEWPECPANDTEECKAKNRRVAIQVEQCK